MSLRIELEPEFEREFREKAMKVYGYSKGSLKRAANVALKKWSASIEIMEPKKMVEIPTKLIRGTLSHLKGKMTSVELQHETRKIWAEEVD